MKQIDKETHVFLKDEDSFTSIAKRNCKGLHQVFTSIKLTYQMADQINNLFSANLEVKRINVEQGFLLIKLKRGSTYMSIVRAVKSVLYGENGSTY